MNISLLEPIGVPDSMIEELAKPIKEKGHNFTYYNTKTTDIEELKERSKNQEIIMIANNKYPEEVVESAKNLKYLAVAFTGIDHVGTDACRKKNIMISNCAGYSNICVAEQVIGMTLSLMRFFKTCDTTVRNGGTNLGLAGTEISGKKVGIIGCGRIGFMVAKLFKSFNAEVIAYDNYQDEKVKSAGITYVSLNELLTTSDIITVHTPNNKDTRHLLGEKQFAIMKKSALFINCARGPIVDNIALANALNKNIIAGAAIDVYDIEPPLPADYPLLNTQNTLLTPHVAFLTKESMIRRAKIEFDNIYAYLEGHPKNLCTL